MKFYKQNIEQTLFNKLFAGNEISQTKLSAYLESIHRKNVSMISTFFSFILHTRFKYVAFNNYNLQLCFD